MILLHTDKWFVPVQRVRCGMIFPLNETSTFLYCFRIKIIFRQQFFKNCTFLFWIDSSVHYSPGMENLVFGLKLYFQRMC